MTKEISGSSGLQNEKSCFADSEVTPSPSNLFFIPLHALFVLLLGPAVLFLPLSFSHKVGSSELILIAKSVGLSLLFAVILLGSPI